MAKNSRSIQLNAAIEAELKVMLELGASNVLISPSTLHERLKNQGIVKGGLSTLSTSERKAMIAHYRNLQISNNEDYIEAPQNEYKYGSIAYYKNRNQKLTEIKNELERELSKNTAALEVIINKVESSSPLKVEDLVRHILNPMEDIPY